jgi:hypothetical protein
MIRSREMSLAVKSDKIFSKKFKKLLTYAKRCGIIYIRYTFSYQSLNQVVSESENFLCRDVKKA